MNPNVGTLYGVTYSRFVAIGDSQTEGMGDGDDRAGYRGWADRLADRIACVNPELLYANLAVRGKTTRDARIDQLEPALELHPDLIAAPLGMNDVIGRHDLDEVERDLHYIYRRLAESGATVLIPTYPNVVRTIPVARRVEPWLLRLNQVMRDYADEFGFVLVDLYAAPVFIDLRAWSRDRLHASPLGHDRFAAAAAYALGLPGSDPNWAVPQPGSPRNARVTELLRDARWAVEFFTPWVIRTVRGVSMGDGRAPKRPALEPVISCQPVAG